MKFRFARHTNNLEQLKTFYTQVLGLEILGNFENHKGYDGIFIGKPDLDWHAEFTQTPENVTHTFDEDDILVFYPASRNEFNQIIKKIEATKIEFLTPKNPYWKENGKMILDPDGYRIVFSDLKIE